MGQRPPGLVITYVVLLFGAALALFPLVLMTLNALKGSLQVTPSPLSLPTRIRWDNFSHAWMDAHCSTAPK
jgi:ABC-type glycerol-3-phosphate transport system permease component